MLALSTLYVEKLSFIALIYLDLPLVACISHDNFVSIYKEGGEAPSIVNESKVI